MQIKNINCQELKELVQDKNCLLIDVREKAEFEAGHIPGALFLPLSLLSTAVIPVAPTLILYCQSGYRSKVAAEFIAHQLQQGHLSGVDEIMHLKPGYRQWVIENSGS